MLYFWTEILVIVLSIGLIYSATFSLEPLFAQEDLTEGTSLQESTFEDQPQGFTSEDPESSQGFTSEDPESSQGFTSEDPESSQGSQCIQPWFPAGRIDDAGEPACEPVVTPELGPPVVTPELGLPCSPGYYESNGECFPEEPTPQPQGGAYCSPGYYESNGECFPEEPTPQPQGGAYCSPGYYESNGECFPEEPTPQPQGGGGLLPPIVSGPVDRIMHTDPRGFVEDTLNTINDKSPVSTPLIVGVVAVVAIGAGVASFVRHHHGRSSTSHSAQDQTQQDDTEKEQIYEDVQIVTEGGIEGV